MFYAQAGQTSIDADDFKSNQKVNTNNWYCVCAVFDSLTIKTYVNGVLASTGNVIGSTIGTSAAGLTIGRYVGAGPQWPYWYNGIMDDLRLYNRVLNPTEINSFCNLFDTSVAINRDLTGLSLCMNDTLHLPYTVTQPFSSNNTFTAELSDNSGSFSNPVTIGTANANTSGTIICTIPNIATNSNAYKIRIIATTPLSASEEETLTLSTTPMVAIYATTFAPYSPNQYITFKSVVANAGSNVSYQWKRNGQNITGATNDSLYTNTLNDGDSITLEVIDNNTCKGTSNTILAQINTDVQGIPLNNLLLHPNPNNGRFTITADNINYSEIKIEVVNAIGQVVYSQSENLTNNRLSTNINLSNYADGIYLVRLSAEGMQRNIRLIKAE